MTPTARSLAYCRKLGWPVAVVEKWIPQVKKRQDAFGFIDLLVLVPGAILAVQATSGANHASRVKKIGEVPAAGSWLRSGGRIAVWSWEKKGGRGQRKLWTLRTEEVACPDSPSSPASRPVSSAASTTRPVREGPS